MMDEEVNYRDDERRGLDMSVIPATLPQGEVIAGVPSIMGG